MGKRIAATAALSLLAACGPEPAQIPTGEVADLVAVDVRVGEGLVAEPGRIAFVHYTGWLYDPAAEDRRGAEFDSSRSRGRPFNFEIGAGRVIEGWDRGIPGMKVGGRRLLFIPPNLAYGERGAGNDSPPNSTLVFEVELLELRRP